jgi:hypothetical protein
MKLNLLRATLFLTISLFPVSASVVTIGFEHDAPGLIAPDFQSVDAPGLGFEVPSAEIAVSLRKSGPVLIG